MVSFLPAGLSGASGRRCNAWWETGRSEWVWMSPARSADEPPLWHLAESQVKTVFVTERSPVWFPGSGNVCHLQLLNLIWTGKFQPRPDPSSEPSLFRLYCCSALLVSMFYFLLFVILFSFFISVSWSQFLIYLLQLLFWKGRLKNIQSVFFLRLFSFQSVWNQDHSWFSFSCRTLQSPDCILGHPLWKAASGCPTCPVETWDTGHVIQHISKLHLLNGNMAI